MASVPVERGLAQVMLNLQIGDNGSPLVRKETLLEGDNLWNPVAGISLFF